MQSQPHDTPFASVPPTNSKKCRPSTYGLFDFSRTSNSGREWADRALIHSSVDPVHNNSNMARVGEPLTLFMLGVNWFFAHVDHHPGDKASWHSLSQETIAAALAKAAEAAGLRSCVKTVGLTDDMISKSPSILADVLKALVWATFLAAEVDKRDPIKAVRDQMVRVGLMFPHEEPKDTVGTSGS